MGRPSKQRLVANTTLGPMGIAVADFLKGIEERPVLFDRIAAELDDNKTRLARDAAWREMISMLLPKFKNLPEAEQAFLINKTYKRSWKAHRDLLLKTVHRKQSGDPRFKPYTFRKEMAFFIKAKGIAPEDTRYSDDNDDEEEVVEEGTRKRKQQDGPCIKTESANDSISDQHNKNSKKAKSSTSQVTETVSNTSTPYSSERLRQRSSSANTTPNKNAAKKNVNRNTEVREMSESMFDPMFFCQTTANASIEQQGPTNPEASSREISTTKEASSAQMNSVNYGYEDCADAAFFDSIKPSLRKMGETQKLDFKIEVLQLLKKYQN